MTPKKENIQLDFSDIDSLQQTEVTYGKTTFYFRRLPNTEAWPLFLKIREDFGPTLVPVLAPILNEPAASVQAMLSFLLETPTTKLIDLQNRLFATVDFERIGTVSRQCVLRAEDTAFNMEPEIGPLTISEIFIRSFCVNFLPSLQSLWDMFTTTP